MTKPGAEASIMTSGSIASKSKTLGLATFLAAGLMALGSSALAQAESYGFDPEHSTITFGWNHAGISQQSGNFRTFKGELNLDREDISNSAIEVTIDVASMDTGVIKLDEDLLPNFFEAEKYPQMIFKSTAVHQSAADRAQVTGDLTIHGVTKSVTLDVLLTFEGPHPLGQFIEYLSDKYVVGMEARTEILRSDFDVGAYAPLVSDRIEIVIVAEMWRR